MAAIEPAAVVGSEVAPGVEAGSGFEVGSVVEPGVEVVAEVVLVVSVLAVAVAGESNQAGRQEVCPDFQATTAESVAVEVVDTVHR